MEIAKQTQANRKKVRMSMVVEQHYNPRWNPENGPENEYIYKVVKAVNLIDPMAAIGKVLTASDVQAWVDFGVDVTIQPVK